MEENHKLTKKELKEQRRLEKLEKAASAQGNKNMTAIIIGVVVVLFVAFFGYMIYSAKHQQAVDAAKPVQIANTGWFEGSPTAPNTLTEFADFQCPACGYFEPMVEKLLQDDKGKFKLQYKYFPLQMHQYAMITAEAAEAAGRQGKFWPMHDQLFKQQEAIENSQNPQPIIDKIAQSIGLNMDQFHKDMKDKSVAAKIQSIQDEGIKLGVNETPTFYVNGHHLINPSSDYNTFKAQVESYFKSSPASK